MGESAPDLLTARTLTACDLENPNYGRLQDRYKELLRRREARESRRCESARGKDERRQPRRVKSSDTLDARGYRASQQRPAPTRDEARRRSAKDEKRIPKGCRRDVDRLGPASPQRPLHPAPYFNDETRAAGAQDFLHHTNTMHERYKDPYCAGAATGMTHPITEEPFVEDWDFRTMMSDLGDGVQRSLPTQHELFKKAIVGYSGLVPQWEHHHGVGETFSKRREACIKKHIVAPDPKQVAEGEVAERLHDAERKSGKGPQLAGKLSRLSPKVKEHIKSNIPGTPWANHDDVFDHRAITPHLLASERQVPLRMTG
eukprot:TRINITY_DN102605_c0_g1_i1.p1 TRINITY_DN102605_c0_g1~~TRINITY_DN102605_c0_g1_i1.p1  ORF type:complete len:367 (-),score=47.25 TRINITY_DN102605_c0_g1_i1:292-1236(-)